MFWPPVQSYEVVINVIEALGPGVDSLFFRSTSLLHNPHQKRVWRLLPMRQASDAVFKTSGSEIS